MRGGGEKVNGLLLRAPQVIARRAPVGLLQLGPDESPAHFHRAITLTPDASERGKDKVTRSGPNCQGWKIPVDHSAVA